MSSFIRSELAPGVCFTAIGDTRFKTMRISATALVPLDAGTVSSYALLSQVMTRSCAEYPDFTALSKKLSSLYGASLEAGVRKLGESLALTFSVSGIDDRYALGGECVSSELSRLLCSVIFEPKLTGDCEFDSDETQQERRQLLELADSDFNDKRVYSNIRLIEQMCAGEAYGVRRYGTTDTIRAVTTADLYKAWRTLLSTARFEIMYIGESSADTAKGIFAQRFSDIERSPAELSTQIIGRADKVREYTEVMEVAQAKLLMGFRTDCSSQSGDTTALRLMCAILGGSAHSKFFTNVREKLSLCYYCFSRCNRGKGIMTVESGVEDKNIEKTKQAVFAEIEAMRSGDITDSEIEFAKLSVSNDFTAIFDTVSGIEEWYLSQLGDKKMLSVKEAIAEFESVDRDRIVKAANDLTLDTVYVLRGE